MVTHNTGIREPNLQTFDQEIKNKIENMGGKVHTGTMVLKGLGTALEQAGEQILLPSLRQIPQINFLTLN
ncbi:MAG: hypothetical protein J5U17_12765 [Candidatus Methanoperedens sp.]|nr:hypothetical protein [Candidatus Methanoperedens sp.]MCE8427544.1 hypothetical protein [Candidatus Methanoperedens sp.]